MSSRYLLNSPSSPSVGTPPPKGKGTTSVRDALYIEAPLSPRSLENKKAVPALSSLAPVNIASRTSPAPPARPVITQTTTTTKSYVYSQQISQPTYVNTTTSKKVVLERNDDDDDDVNMESQYYAVQRNISSPRTVVSPVKPATSSQVTASPSKQSSPSLTRSGKDIEASMEETRQKISSFIDMFEEHRAYHPAAKAAYSATSPSVQRISSPQLPQTQRKDIVSIQPQPQPQVISSKTSSARPISSVSQQDKVPRKMNVVNQIAEQK